MENFKRINKQGILEKNENDGENFLSLEQYKKEIFPIIEILKPDSLSLEEYEKQVTDELFADIKTIQIARGVLYENPDKIIEEIKDLLNSRLKSVLKDAGDYNAKVKPDKDLVKKAKIALFFENDMTEAKKSSYMGEEKIPKISDLRNYIIGYGEKNKFTESDVDSLMKTKYKKSLTSVMNDQMYYIGSYGTMDKIPKSLMIGLVQAEEENPRQNHYYPIKGGLETAEIEKYDNDCLEQLLASDYTRLCLENVDKFKGKPIEKILKSGDSHGDQDPLEYLKKLDLSKEDFDRYLDIMIKHNVCYVLRESFGKFYNKERETTSVYQDAIIRLHDIEMDVHYKNDSQNILNIKDVIENGYIGLALVTTVCRDYIKKYAENDYENFLKDIRKYDQEHLVFEYLKDEDKIEYANKLIEQGEEYQIVKLHELFKEHSLNSEIFSKIKNKNLICSLKGDLSQFKELPPEEAVDFIDRERTNIFINNISSFSFPKEFLKNEKVQEACFIEFNKEIMTYNPSQARIISEKIPFSKEKLDQAVLKAVKYKWLEADGGRNDWARAVIYEFPKIKEFLNNEEDKERALRDLNKQLESGYTESVASILECFYLPEETFGNENIIKKITETIQRGYRSCGYRGDDIFKDFYREQADVERISKYITLPGFVYQMGEIVKKVEGLPMSPFNIKKEIIQKILISESPDILYSNIINLYEEVQSHNEVTMDKNIILAYISKFEDGGTEKDKNAFFEKISEDVKTVAQNKPVDFFGNKDYYTYILKEVYLTRNYNTYENIDKYEDRTKDLDKYVFDRNGYELKLSGVLGYKIREGVETNQVLIDEFLTRIKSIKSIATTKTLSEFLEKNIQDGSAKTIEGKILEYFKQNGYTVDTMNVLLAYQLLGSYDSFVASSVDRVSLEENQTSKNYILLDELVNQYGDNMKETIKSIQGGVAKSEDKDIFSGSLNKYHKRYNEIFEAINSDLQKIPRDKITDQTIQKKVLKMIKNTFQGVENIQKRVEYFASLFSVNDLDNFSEVWNNHINELFAIDEDSSIDTSKVESLQSSIFTKLQNEISKYEEIKEIDENKGEAKLKKERIIKAYFSKNRENANARMVGDVCLANDPNMLKNEKYFEFVFFDEEREKCMGTTMLLQMDEPEDNKKYLLYCPNPSVGLVSEVSAKKLYQMITKQISKFAQENNFDGVIVDKRHGHSTNRSGLFQQSLEQSCLKDETGKEREINLKNNHTLSGSYSYQKNLQIVWEK